MKGNAPKPRMLPEGWMPNVDDALRNDGIVGPRRLAMRTYSNYVYVYLGTCFLAHLRLTRKVRYKDLIILAQALDANVHPERNKLEWDVLTAPGKIGSHGADLAAAGRLVNGIVRRTREFKHAL